VIDFRYHLVSIVAVFLALAIGIVVGAGALQGPTLKTLEKTSQEQTLQVQSLLAAKRRLDQQISSDQAFAQAGSGVLLDHLLDGERVVLVYAPNADSQTVSGITAALQQAGAKVTGQIGLQPSFFDTTAVTEASLRTLAQGLDPRLNLGADAADSPVGGQQAAAQVIAEALVTGKNGGWTAAQSHSILAGFGQRGYLQVSNAGAAGGTILTAPATLAVVVIPSAPPATAVDPANLALISLAQQLQLASHGTVVAGSLAGSGPGSAIDEISSSGVKLTTVDSADVETGQITVVQALSYLLAGQKPASYGVGPGAYPSPAPTPVPTGAADPAVTGPGRKPSHPGKQPGASKQPGTSKQPAASPHPGTQ
jgi:hypothetical protein